MYHHKNSRNRTIAHLNVSSLSIDPIETALIVVDVHITKENLYAFKAGIEEFTRRATLRSSLHFDSSSSLSTKDKRTDPCFLFSWLNLHGGLHFSFNFHMKQLLGENFYWGRHRAVSRIYQLQDDSQKAYCPLVFIHLSKIANSYYSRRIPIFDSDYDSFETMYTPFQVHLSLKLKKSFLSSFLDQSYPIQITGVIPSLLFESYIIPTKGDRLCVALFTVTFKSQKNESFVLTQEELRSRKDSYLSLDVLIEIIDMNAFLTVFNFACLSYPLFPEKWLNSLNGVYSSDLPLVDLKDKSLYIAAIRQHNMFCRILSPFTLIIPLLEPLSMHLRGFPELFQTAQRLSSTTVSESTSEHQLPPNENSAYKATHFFTASISGESFQEFLVSLNWKLPDIESFVAPLSDYKSFEFSWNPIDVEIFLEDLLNRPDHPLDEDKEFYPFAKLVLEPGSVTYIHTCNTKRTIYESLFKGNLSLRLKGLSNVKSNGDVPMASFVTSDFEECVLVNAAMFFERIMVKFLPSVVILKFSYTSGFLTIPWVLPIGENPAKSLSVVPWSFGRAFWPSGLRIVSHESSGIKLKADIAFEKFLFYFLNTFDVPQNFEFNINLSVKVPIRIPLAVFVQKKSSSSMSIRYLLTDEYEKQKFSFCDIFIPPFSFEGTFRDTFSLEFFASSPKFLRIFSLFECLSLEEEPTRLFYLPLTSKLFCGFLQCNSYFSLVSASKVIGWARSFLSSRSSARTKGYGTLDRVINLLLMSLQIVPDDDVFLNSASFVPLAMTAGALEWDLNISSEENSVHFESLARFNTKGSHLSKAKKTPGLPSYPLSISWPDIELELSLPSGSKSEPSYRPFCAIKLQAGILRFRSLSDFSEIQNGEARTSQEFSLIGDLFNCSNDTYRLRLLIQRIIYTRANSRRIFEDINNCFNDIFYRITFAEHCSSETHLRAPPFLIYELLHGLYSWVMLDNPATDKIRRDQAAFAMEIAPSSFYIDRFADTKETALFEAPCIIPSVCFKKHGEISFPVIKVDVIFEKLLDRLLSILVTFIRPYIADLILDAYPSVLLTKINLQSTIDMDVTLSGIPYFILAVESGSMSFVNSLFDISPSFSDYPPVRGKLSGLASFCQDFEEMKEWMSPYFFKSDYLISFKKQYNDPLLPTLTSLDPKLLFDSKPSDPLKIRPATLDFSTNYIVVGEMHGERKRNLTLLASIISAYVPEVFFDTPPPDYISPFDWSLVDYKILRFNREGITLEISLDVTFSLPGFLFSFTPSIDDYFIIDICYCDKKLVSVRADSVIVPPLLGINTMKLVANIDTQDFEQSEYVSDFFTKMVFLSAFDLSVKVNWHNTKFSGPVVTVHTTVSFHPSSAAADMVEDVGLGLGSYQLKFKNPFPKCFLHFVLFSIDLIPEDVEFYYQHALDPPGLENETIADKALEKSVSEFQKRHWNILPYRRKQRADHSLRLFDFVRYPPCKRHPCLNLFKDINNPTHEELFEYQKCVYTSKDHPMKDMAFLTLGHTSQLAVPSQVVYDFAIPLELPEISRYCMTSATCRQVRCDLLLLLELDIPINSEYLVEPFYLRIPSISTIEVVPGGCFEFFDCVPSTSLFMANLQCSFHTDGSSLSEVNCSDVFHLYNGATLKVVKKMPVLTTFFMSFKIQFNLQTSIFSMLSDRVFTLVFFSSDESSLTDRSDDHLTSFALQWNISPKNNTSTFLYLEDNVPISASQDKTFLIPEIPVNFLTASAITIDIHYVNSSKKFLVQMTEPKTNTKLYSFLDIDLPLSLGSKYSNIQMMSLGYLAATISEFKYAIGKPAFDLTFSRILHISEMPSSIAHTDESRELGVHNELESISGYCDRPNKSHPGLYFVQVVDACRRPISYPVELFDISFVLTPGFLRSGFKFGEQFHISPSFDRFNLETIDSIGQHGLVPFFFKPSVPGRYCIQACFTPIFDCDGQFECHDIGSIYVALYP